MQFLWSNGAACFGLTFTSYELVDIVSAIASLAAGVLLLRFWRPRVEWRFAHDGAGPRRGGGDALRGAGGAGLDAVRDPVPGGDGLGRSRRQGVDGRAARTGRHRPGDPPGMAHAHAGATSGRGQGRGGLRARTDRGGPGSRDPGSGPGVRDRHGRLSGGRVERDSARSSSLAAGPESSGARCAGCCPRSGRFSACWRWAS